MLNILKKGFDIVVGVRNKKNRLIEAIFSFYKHTLASPNCVLKKYKEKKKRKIFFYLSINNKKNSKFEDIDMLISSIRRSQLFIVNE